MSSTAADAMLTVLTQTPPSVWGRFAAASARVPPMIYFGITIRLWGGTSRPPAKKEADWII
jgi:hypothetical protein